MRDQAWEIRSANTKWKSESLLKFKITSWRAPFLFLIKKKTVNIFINYLNKLLPLQWIQSVLVDAMIWHNTIYVFLQLQFQYLKELNRLPSCCYGNVCQLASTGSNYLLPNGNRFISSRRQAVPRTIYIQTVEKKNVQLTIRISHTFEKMSFSQRWTM